MSFWYLQFSQKMNDNILLYYYGTSSLTVFVRFFGELKTPLKHFEINWPLKYGSLGVLGHLGSFAYFYVYWMYFLFSYWLNGKPVLSPNISTISMTRLSLHNLTYFTLYTVFLLSKVRQINDHHFWSCQKMSITKNVLLSWYSSMKKKMRKIRTIFDKENWLWKSGGWVILHFLTPPH